MKERRYKPKNSVSTNKSRNWKHIKIKTEALCCKPEKIKKLLRAKLYAKNSWSKNNSEKYCYSATNYEQKIMKSRSWQILTKKKPICNSYQGATCSVILMYFFLLYINTHKRNKTKTKQAVIKYFETKSREILQNWTHMQKKLKLNLSLTRLRCACSRAHSRWSVS